MFKKAIALVTGFLIAGFICILIGTYDVQDVFKCGMLGSCVALLLINNNCSKEKTINDGLIESKRVGAIINCPPDDMKE